MVGDRWWVLKLSLEGENKSEGDLTSKVIVLGKNLEQQSVEPSGAWRDKCDGRKRPVRQLFHSL